MLKHESDPPLLSFAHNDCQKPADLLQENSATRTWIYAQATNTLDMRSREKSRQRNALHNIEEI